MDAQTVQKLTTNVPKINKINLAALKVSASRLLTQTRPPKELTSESNSPLFASLPSSTLSIRTRDSSLWDSHQALIWKDNTRSDLTTTPVPTSQVRDATCLPGSTCDPFYLRTLS